MIFLSHRVVDWLLETVAWMPYRAAKKNSSFKALFAVAVVCCGLTAILFPVAIIGAIIAVFIEPVVIIVGLVNYCQINQTASCKTLSLTGYVGLQRLIPNLKISFAELISR